MRPQEAKEEGLRPICHPHVHRCRKCGGRYEGMTVWDIQDFQRWGECACPEDRVCFQCEREARDD